MEQSTFYPKSREDWRKWLKENHQSEQSVWLIAYKSSTKIPSVIWSDAVEEALCFGWIDSTRRTIDEDSYMQYFSKRKPNSTWSKVNKDKVAILIQEKQMTQAGLDSIKTAKENGSWSILDEVEKLIVPEDLQKEFDIYPKASDFFSSLSKSKRKEILTWIVFAKRPETRAKRIKEIIACAIENKKPKHIV